MSISEKLLDVFEDMVNDKVNKYENMDYKAIIVGVIDAYKYKIRYNGEIFTVPNATSKTFKVGDNVWIHRPNGDNTKQFIIASENGLILDSGSSTGGHTHPNKDLLDGITSNLITNWNYAYTHSTQKHAPIDAEKNIIEGIKLNGSIVTPDSNCIVDLGNIVATGGSSQVSMHNHQNKDVLDKITYSLITNWNYAYTHSTQPHAPIDAEKNIIEGIKLNGTIITPNSSRIVDLGNIIVSSSGSMHSHDNKSILDSITTALIANWNYAYTHATQQHAPMDAEKNIINGIKLNGNIITPDSSRIIDLGSIAVTSVVHNHANKDVLDGITAALIDKWNEAERNVINGIKLNGNIITPDSGRIVDLGDISVTSGSGHTHTNKDILDGITSSLITNWNEAYRNIHNHSNKTVLDGITSSLIDKWTKKVGALKLNGSIITPDSNYIVDLGSIPNTDYIDNKIDGVSNNLSSNYYTKDEIDNSVQVTSVDGMTGDVKLENSYASKSSEHTHSNKSALDGITSTLINSWNIAYKNEHIHQNKGILDGITSTLVERWNNAYTHSTQTHAPVNAEENKIEGIKLNGNVVSPDADRVVDLGSIPTTEYVDKKVDGVDNKINVVSNNITSNYYTKSEIDNTIAPSLDIDSHVPDFTESTSLIELFKGDNISVITGKLAKAIADLKNLINFVGKIDISGIGDGTITGAIDYLNNSFTDNYDDIIKIIDAVNRVVI